MDDPAAAGRGIGAPEVRLRPWGECDLPLLEAANTPQMTAHLGGPETDAAIRARHEKYLRFAVRPDAGIGVVECEGDAVGCVNWWASEHDGAPVTEMGWFVLPAAQGRGIARTAVRLAIADARHRSPHRSLFAFPAVDNAPSNALCAGTGFVRDGETDFPYRDTVLRVAVWRIDLDAPAR